MAPTLPGTLVSTEWLAEQLERPGPRVRVVDGSWHMPNLARDPRREFEEAHIPGAVFFDIDAIADRSTSLPHMLPGPVQFGRQVGELGISDRDLVVVYDVRGVVSAARVWWTFRTMGHDRVAVLDGGLRKWRAEGRPVETGPAPVAPARYRARIRRSLPYDELYQPDGTFRPAEELRAAFASAGVDPARPVATTCGSGITASVLALGLYLVGRRKVAVYDGSWTEWAGHPDTPVES